MIGEWLVKRLTSKHFLQQMRILTLLEPGCTLVDVHEMYFDILCPHCCDLKVDAVVTIVWEHGELGEECDVLSVKRYFLIGCTHVLLLSLLNIHLEHKISSVTVYVVEMLSQRHWLGEVRVL